MSLVRLRLLAALDEVLAQLVVGPNSREIARAAEHLEARIARTSTFVGGSRQTGGCQRRDG